LTKNVLSCIPDRRLPDVVLLDLILRNVTQTLIENPGTTFGEIPFLFWNEGARDQLVTNVKNQQVRLFWERYNHRSRRDREEYGGMAPARLPTGHLQDVVCG
jgi:hypothetical protein